MSLNGPRLSSLEDVKRHSVVGEFGLKILSPTMELRSYKANLILGGLLGFIAGVVNSVSFLGLGGYVSHISGHATRAAVEYSQNHAHVAVTYASAILFFMTGAALTTILLKGHSLQSKHAVMGFPLMIEAIILLAVALSTQKASIQWLPLDDPLNAGYIYFLSLAMGLQNALVTYISGAKVRTTHMTGIATDIGMAIGAGIIHAKTNFSSVKKIKNIKEIGLFISEFRRKLFFLHICILLSFALGAILGTYGYYQYSFLILLLPISILFLIAGTDMLFHFKRWRKKL